MEEWLPDGDKWWLGVYIGIGLMVIMVVAPQLSWLEEPMPTVIPDREVITDMDVVCGDRMGINSRGQRVCG